MQRVRSCTEGQRDETSITLVFRDGIGLRAFGWLPFVDGRKLEERVRPVNRRLMS